MAYLHSNGNIDLRQVNFWAAISQTDYSQIYLDVNIVLDGQDVPGIPAPLAVQDIYQFWSGSPSAELATSIMAFAGDNWVVDQSENVMSGVVTAVILAEHLPDGNDNYFVISGFSVSAVSVQTVSSTQDEADDQLLLNQMLAGHDSMVGSGFDDYIFARNGNDTMHGGAGADQLYGDAGNDVLNGDVGDDQLYGGSGNDTADGGVGNDSIVGLSGNDRLLGFHGNDTLNGGVGNDSIYGGTGNDRLYGSTGNDALYGGVGSDLFYGGAGTDNMAGGVDTVVDTFYFYATTESVVGAARDRISNFVSGIDRINLAGIDANAVATGNQAFGFSTTGPANNSVWTVSSGGNLFVRADATGDGVADFEIYLLSVTSLTAADFVL